MGMGLRRSICAVALFAALGVVRQHVGREVVQIHTSGTRKLTFNTQHQDELSPLRQTHTPIIHAGRLLRRGNNGVSTVIPSTRRLDDTKNVDNARYLAFGTSVTWGAGLADRRSAYPFLLSPAAKNAAIRSSGPMYPLLCAESIVGSDDDSVFDVIVFEFHHGGDALSRLARRLRQRFPDAVIIVYGNWYPFFIYNEDKQHVKDWADSNGLDDLHSESFKEAFRKSDEHWQWGAGFAGAEVQRETVREVGGFYLPLPRPEDPRDFIDYADFFASDWHHLSEKGHQYIASKVKEIVSSAGIEANPQLGSWANRDSCHSWFESGEYPFDHSPNIEMEMFHPEHKKYALSIPREGGSIIVRNPSEKQMALYLTYMVTGPPPSKYPRTEVTIGGKSSASIVLDALAPAEFGHRVHISVTKSVGKVDPGDNVIMFRPLEDTPYPFRLISTVIADSDISSDGQFQTRGDFAVSTTDDK